MRKYKEFTADYVTETNGITGAHVYDSQPTTIDLYSIVSFNPGDDYHHTTVRLQDGTVFDFKITYQAFKQIVRQEVPDLFMNAN